jgi:hypothetical protein
MMTKDKKDEDKEMADRMVHVPRHSIGRFGKIKQENLRHRMSGPGYSRPPTKDNPGHQMSSLPLNNSL